MHQTHHDDPERLVHVHLRVHASVRRALRLVAAHRGCAMAEVVKYWTMAEANSLGLTVAKDGVRGR